MASLYVFPDEGVVAASICNSWGHDARAGEMVFGGVERIVARHVAE